MPRKPAIDDPHPREIFTDLDGKPFRPTANQRTLVQRGWQRVTDVTIGNRVVAVLWRDPVSGRDFKQNDAFVIMRARREGGLPR